MRVAQSVARNGNPSPWRGIRTEARDSSTPHELRIREVRAPLRMTERRRAPRVGSFNDWGFCVGGVFFVGVNFAVVFGVEGAGLGVGLLRRYGPEEAVFLSFEAGGVIAAVQVDHAFGKRSGVNQFGERRGEVVVLLVELVLGADHDSHIGKGCGLGIRAGGVAAKFRLIGWGRGLRRRGRRSGGRRLLREEGGGCDGRAGDYGKKTGDILFHAESSP